MMEVKYVPGLTGREINKRIPDVWEFLLDLDRRLRALESGNEEPDIPMSAHILNAVDYLLDARRITPDEAPPEVIERIAVTRAREWSPNIGWIGKDEIITYMGVTYICEQAHNAQQGSAPGTKSVGFFRPVLDTALAKEPKVEEAVEVPPNKKSKTQAVRK